MLTLPHIEADTSHDLETDRTKYISPPQHDNGSHVVHPMELSPRGSRYLIDCKHILQCMNRCSFLAFCHHCLSSNIFHISITSFHLPREVRKRYLQMRCS